MAGCGRAVDAVGARIQPQFKAGSRQEIESTAAHKRGVTDAAKKGLTRRRVAGTLIC